MLHYVYARLPNQEVRVLRTPQGDKMGFVNRELALHRALHESQFNRSNDYFVHTDPSLDKTRALSLIA